MKAKKTIRKVLIIGIFFSILCSFFILNADDSIVSAADPGILAVAPGACGGPPQKGLTLVIINQMDLLEKRTNGRFKTKIYWGQSIANARDSITAVSTGICDIAKIDPSYEPGKVPLSFVGQMPGVGTHMWPRGMAYWDLMNQEILLSEYKKFGLLPLTLTLLTEATLISREPIRSIADLKGKKLAAFGLEAETVSLLGCVPISMSPPEQYDALKKGIIAGLTAPWDAISNFKFYEGGKYLTAYQFAFRIMPTLIREETWNNLPADIQKIIFDSAPDLIKIAYEDFIAGDEIAKKVMVEQGVEIIEPGDADKAELKKVQAGQADKWAEDLEKKGLPGKKILADFRAVTEKYEKVNPYK